MQISRLILLLFILTTSSLCTMANFLSSEKVKTYNQKEVRIYFDNLGLRKSIIPANNGIDVYRILYQIPGLDKKPTQVSGLILVPQGSTKPLPLLSYQHGTNLAKEDAPSISFEREYAIAMIFAADGYAVTMPDYLGLGLSKGFHPYMHAVTEADAVIGLIRTVKANASEFGIELNKQLYLTGYSQGAHATMAAQMVLERDFSHEFTVTASAPMSGVYDMSGVQTDFIFGASKVSQVGYLSYLIFAYNKIYHFTDSFSNYFLPPFDTLLPPMFDGTHHYPELVKMLPSDPDPLLVIKEEVWNSFINDPENQFIMALEDNNLYSWIPNQPLLMCYCKGDKKVNWRNARVTEKWMNENDAAFVRSKCAGRKFNHRKCAYFAPAYVMWWFDGFRNGKPNGSKGPIGKRFLLSIAKIFVSKN
ncbi:MAG: hypothetical protein JKY18_13610 [Flavobacteriales bacterium]|nr:hypothetical protein [Flavobacteriales bacterium]